MDKLAKEYDWITARCGSYRDMVESVYNELNSHSIDPNVEIYTWEQCWDMVKTALNEQNRSLICKQLEGIIKFL